MNGIIVQSLDVCDPMQGFHPPILSGLLPGMYCWVGTRESVTGVRVGEGVGGMGLGGQL